jgi:UDP-glucose 4-epimerase
MKKILLTGGLGYIGSHVVVELAAQGFEVIIMDDLSNSELFVLDRLKELTGKEITFEKGDIRDHQFLDDLFSKHKIDGVIHFAAKKAVGESVKEPLLYYDVNVSGLNCLLKVIKNHSIKKLIFSSSCTIYGSPERFPVTEHTPFGNTPSPYGKTKQMCEQVLKDISVTAKYDIVSLRYFNPVGAHSSGRIGELPKGVPNNLVPFITQTAAGLRDELQVFGGNYDTPDGTAVRDYIHVVDLAKAHVSALKASLEKYIALNVGTGRGYSVLEVVNTFQELIKENLSFKIVERREGDIQEIYGDTKLANEKLGWKAEKGLAEMLKDAWNWQKSLS